ncbi:hypothetical protein GJ689_16990 [Rhodoplanes serenus]|uniref:Uncharacterized protein n=1 Tax=Rhodoplanes serenus TaxID=200615 RepID=A0A9X4XMI6_9BRAD|nr:hypothetical protein [Rhodoplanes serenus]MTW17905.1 hypothetical protein [Rhodoplanes serenus]
MGGKITDRLRINTLYRNWSDRDEAVVFDGCDRARCGLDATSFRREVGASIAPTRRARHIAPIGRARHMAPWRTIEVICAEDRTHV